MKSHAVFFAVWILCAVTGPGFAQSQQALRSFLLYEDGKGITNTAQEIHLSIASDASGGGEVIAGGVGAAFGTLVGGYIGARIGAKHDRDEFIGAVQGAIIGAYTANALMIPLSVHLENNHMQLWPLARGVLLTGATGFAGYHLAMAAEVDVFLLIGPFIQIGTAVVNESYAQ